MTLRRCYVAKKSKLTDQEWVLLRAEWLSDAEDRPTEREMAENVGMSKTGFRLQAIDRFGERPKQTNKQTKPLKASEIVGLQVANRQGDVTIIPPAPQERVLEQIKVIAESIKAKRAVQAKLKQAFADASNVYDDAVSDIRAQMEAGISEGKQLMAVLQIYTAALAALKSSADAYANAYGIDFAHVVDPDIEDAVVRKLSE